MFEDVLADPAKDGANLVGPFAGLAFLMKALRPTTKGRPQEMGSLYMRDNRADADTFLTSQMRKAGLNLIGRTTTSAGALHGADHACVHRKLKPGRSGDGVRLGWGTI